VIVLLDEMQEILKTQFYNLLKCWRFIILHSC